ncbi:hypothetical protein R1flu_007568 [Riccia fluitans]|uniref:Uncharacterized protein n=1 Tax=Riccia fluitans TaxID=41844 RepID=A0ABD1Z0F6_9MARC
MQRTPTHNRRPQAITHNPDTRLRTILAQDIITSASTLASPSSRQSNFNEDVNSFRSSPGSSVHITMPGLATLSAPEGVQLMVTRDSVRTRYPMERPHASFTPLASSFANPGVHTKGVGGNYRTQLGSCTSRTQNSMDSRAGCSLQ